MERLALSLALLRKLSQRNGQVSGCALQAVGTRFEFFRTVLGAHGDGSQGRFHLSVQTFGGCLRFLFGTCQLSRG
jgi:hypothetical protein